MTRFDANTSVGELVAQFPQAARLFEDLQIDYCCGGRATLKDACSRRQLDVAETLEQLTRTLDDSEQPSEDPSAMTLSQLADHIEQTHHAYLRDELPRLSAMVEKVEAAHSDKHTELHDLRKAFEALRAELEPHMFKEERILFPAIRMLEQAEHRPSFPFGTVANPIQMMEHEHDVAGDALATIRNLTHGFRLPDDACNTYRVMLDSLRRLEQDMHLHIHKENNVLFPRAQAIELDRAETIDQDHPA